MREDAVSNASQLIKRVYHFYVTGGGLHIVLDDFNIDDADIDFCLSLPLSTVERKCAEALRSLSKEERIAALGIEDQASAVLPS